MSQQIIRSAKYNKVSNNEVHDSENVFLFEPKTDYPKKKTIKTKKILTLIGILAIVCTIASMIAIILSQIWSIEVPCNKSNCTKFTANSSSFSLKHMVLSISHLLYLREKNNWFLFNLHFSNN